MCKKIGLVLLVGIFLFSCAQVGQGESSNEMLSNGVNAEESVGSAIMDASLSPEKVYYGTPYNPDNPNIIRWVNIAPGARVRARTERELSTTELSHAEYAIDGDVDTSWLSANYVSGGQEWIYVDLGSIREFEAVRLAWHELVPPEGIFEIGVANSQINLPSSWTFYSVAIPSSGSMDNVYKTKNPISCRYIGVRVPQGQNNRYLGLREFQVLDSPTMPNHSFGLGTAPTGLYGPSLSQADMNSHITTLYDQWKSNYMDQMIFTDGAVNRSFLGAFIRTELIYDFPAEYEFASFSEAFGYGMILSVLMAGHDKEAQLNFDRLYKTYLNFPSSDHADLMSWGVPIDGDLGAHNRLPSATDGDMDVAYALIMAHNQWGGGPCVGPERSYYDGAVSIINALAENNVYLQAPANWDGASRDFFPRLGIGDNRTIKNYSLYQATRSSDFMFSHLDLFNQVAPNNGLWVNVQSVMHQMVDYVQTGGGDSSEIISSVGLMPDFLGNNELSLINSKPIQAFEGISDEPPGSANPGMYDNDYWYNSCRVPWRFTLAYTHNEDSRILTAMENMNNWAYANAESLQGGYDLDGNVLPGHLYTDACFQAPIMAGLTLGLGDNPATNTSSTVTTMWNTVKNFANDHVATTKKDSYSKYYSNSISLLSMLLVSGNWWEPSGTP